MRVAARSDDQVGRRRSGDQSGEAAELSEGSRSEPSPQAADARRFTATTPDADTPASDNDHRSPSKLLPLHTNYAGTSRIIRVQDSGSRPVTDVASRHVVGWATADHLRTELVVEALTAACRQSRPTHPFTFHSARAQVIKKRAPAN